MKILRWQCWCLVVLCVALPTFATDLGEPAPALKIKEWIKGEAVDLKEGQGKNIYVVEFWATWCPPCRTSIPHLTDLQAKLKAQNVVFIGISDENPITVKPFVEQLGDKMNYIVAVDDNRKTYDAYMRAFGVGGIPHAFVVNKEGKIVWHGHPMGDLRNVLTQVIAHKFDLANARRAANADKISQDYLKQARAGKAAADLRSLADTVLKDGANNPEVLNHLSWTILTGTGIKDRDLELAVRAAKIAYDETEGKQAPIVDTYARALFDTGKVPEAIAMQKSAVELADDARTKEKFTKTLEGYEKKAEK